MLISLRTRRFAVVFLAEGRTANLVQHDGVVTVLDEGETDDGRPFLVMELLKERALAARLLRDGPLPWGEVLECGVAVSEVLAAAHARDIVHRDRRAGYCPSPIARK